MGLVLNDKTHRRWNQWIEHRTERIEPNTLFHHQPPTLPDDDVSATIQEQGHAQLAQHGYQHYETSAFAKKERQCFHNLNYWRFGDYLGIGAGAHGKITNAPQQTITRTTKSRSPKDYLDAKRRQVKRNDLSEHDASIEFMMNALRLNEGFETALFSERTGLGINAVEPALRRAEELELITWDIHRIQPTERGQRYLNNLLNLFLN